VIRWFDAHSFEGDPLTDDDIIGSECVLDEIGFFIGENEKYIYMVREIQHGDPTYRFGMAIPKVNIQRITWLNSSVQD
jgi:hypothetical protein